MSHIFLFEFKCQRHLSFLKIDMRHWGGPRQGPHYRDPPPPRHPPSFLLAAADPHYSCIRKMLVQKKIRTSEPIAISCRPTFFTTLSGYQEERPAGRTATLLCSSRCVNLISCVLETNPDLCPGKEVDARKDCV